MYLTDKDLSSKAMIKTVRVLQIPFTTLSKSDGMFHFYIDGELFASVECDFFNDKQRAFFESIKEY